MNEKELIEETVGGNIKRIKKELVHILVDDEEIKSSIISECVDIINERLIEKLEDIKTEIAVIPTQICLGSQDKTTRAYRQRSLAEYEKDLFELIDNHISELKGENKE